MKRTLLCLPFVLLAATTAHAEFPTRGFIQNYAGEGCMFTQTAQEGSHHFYGSELTSILRTVTFIDESCMTGSSGEMAVNIANINAEIARPYSHADANFALGEHELMNSSFMQKRGRCIQSRKYPIIGVAVEYVKGKTGIAKVYHATTANGCTN